MYNKFNKFKKPQTTYVYESEPYSGKCEICGRFLTKKNPVCFSCPMDQFRHEEEFTDSTRRVEPTDERQV